MNAAAAAVAAERVAIEIDGKPLSVPKGSMIIEAADRAGIPIPRFCYHEKLPIAANCRMCLVDVEKAPKPMPACATPVMDGMKVYTRSKRALDAQRNVMEFLLINHPLDCPICDQGGECELQDLALGYGRSVSRFSERKRVVADEDLGPLVSTDMTRCIHCTRCVRFSAEIAGTYELGGIGRGEHLEIGTYIGRAMSSELSGNIIDVCPVGALTNKVFRFRARAWELIARESIAYHDALGSNLWLHTRRGEVLRTVPRDNEAINECWLSDRDRYSHQGLVSPQRLTRPLLRGADGALSEASWDEALAFVAGGLAKLRAAADGAALAVLAAPLTSAEEGLLLARLARGLGATAIDHRLRLVDANDGCAGPTFELPLATLERAGALLLVGCWPRHEAPLLGHRIRKAAQRGAVVHVLNPVDFEFNHALGVRRIVEPWAMLDELARLLAAAGGDPALEPALAPRLAAAEPLDPHREIVAALRAANSVLLFGDIAAQHPVAATLRALARALARATGAAFNELAPGANAVGLARAGVRPLAGPNGAAAILARRPRALLTWQLEALDCAEPARLEGALRGATFAVHAGAYADAATRAAAHAILPIALPPESDGTLVNCDGIVQRYVAGASPPGDSRPGWRVLRALGAALGLPGFEADELGALRAELDPLLATPLAPATVRLAAVERPDPASLLRVATVPIYRGDAVLRRAVALQATPLARTPAVVLHPEDANALGLGAGMTASVSDGEHELRLPVAIERAVARGAAWIDYGHAETAMLAGAGAPLRIRQG